MAKLYDKNPPNNEPDAIEIKNVAAPSKGRRLIADKHQKAPVGFTLKVAQSGAKMFVLRYRVGRRDREVTIGDYKTWSLAAARAQAHEVRRQVDAGVDPLAERARADSEPTVAEAVELYCNRVADRQKNGQKVRRVLDMHLVPKFKHVKLHEVRRAEIIALLERMAEDYPRQAAMLLVYIKLVFAWAEDREIIEANPVATLKPHKIDPRMKPVTRKRVLTDDELAAFWNGVDESPLRRLTALALKLVLVTGQRPGEVAGMRWDEINGDVWVIPASRRGKTETAHLVPLTSTALDIIGQARDEVDRLSKRRRAKRGAFVFETGVETPIKVETMGQAVKRHTAALGNAWTDDGGFWRPHDLRRTCRTRLSEAKVSLPIAEAVIGHTKKGIVATYDLHDYVEEKRTALETWERNLLAIATGSERDNVVPIGARA
ncbi:tyrosine-type recombinase/integrase [Spiribacter roseus]|uniref:tyrosine-type recombinase/integrase n=1 Tax=Spiribacter roseus TaxID=1855875 RepID=UPI00132FFFC7|nr:site-specific integrase [Spiribacter roseus]